MLLNRNIIDASPSPTANGDESKEITTVDSLMVRDDLSIKVKLLGVTWSNVRGI
jgi:hypothetical protein